MSEEMNRIKKDIECAAADAKKVIAEAAIEAKKVLSDSSNNRGFMDILYKQVSLIMSVLSLGGLIIGAFIFLTRPSNENDTALQLQDQRITAQRQTIDEITKTMQNDTKELKSEVAGLRTEIQANTNQITKLQTIIEERIPIKK